MTASRLSPQLAAAFSLLRALTASEEAERAEALRALPRTADWPHLVDWLQAQQLAPLAYHALREAGAGLVPDEALAVLQRAYYQAATQATLRRQELIRVVRMLRTQGVHPVLLEGAALVAQATYPDEALWLMGDIDLLVRREQLDTARRTLEALGYEPRFKPDHPFAWQDMVGGELQMSGIRPGQGLVKPHWRVYPGDWARLASGLDEETPWRRLRPLTLEGLEVRQLHPTDALIHLCLHAAVNHQFTANGLRLLVDIHRLVQAEEVDWADVVEAARGQRVCTVVHTALSYARVLLNTPVAPFVLEALRPPAWRRWLLARLLSPLAVCEGARLSRCRRRYPWLLLMADRLKDSLRLICLVLFPGREWPAARCSTHPGAAPWRRRVLRLWRFLRHDEL